MVYNEGRKLDKRTTPSHLCTCLWARNEHRLGRDRFRLKELPEAALCFRWTFAELTCGRTKITQRLTLSGSNADAFLDQVSVFEQNIPQGMRKVAAAIEKQHLVDASGRV